MLELTPEGGVTLVDIQFLRLSENWALATDGIQWIVQRARRNRNKVGGLEWRAVAFVASDKGVLHRVLREKGAVIDSEGLEALRRLPETFREWRDAQKAVVADEPMRRAA